MCVIHSEVSVSVVLHGCLVELGKKPGSDQGYEDDIGGDRSPIAFGHTEVVVSVDDTRMGSDTLWQGIATEQWKRTTH